MEIQVTGMAKLYIIYIVEKKTKTLKDVPKLYHDKVLGELDRMLEAGEITEEEYKVYTDAE